MRNPKVLSLVLSGAVALAACADQTSDRLPTSVAPTLAVSAGPADYIVSTSKGLSRGFAADVAARGDRLVYLHEAAGFAVVHTANPSAYSGLGVVVPDASAVWVGKEDARRVVDTGADAANPPASGDDDFFFDRQWGHDAVNAPEAWNAGVRGAGVLVAVLDDGIDSDHPDLAPNLRTDLSRSFVPGETFEYDSGIPGDAFSHGSHTAGTIGAADNGYGTIGVAPDAEIVMVKVLASATGSGDFSWIMEGILYAADIGADVVNMSLGASFDGHVYNDFKKVLDNVTRYADNQGVTLIASAGNDGEDYDLNKPIVHVPSDNARVLSISATGPQGWWLGSTSFDLIASYSNFGKRPLEFSAPGGSYDYPGTELCTIPNRSSPLPCYVMDYVFSTGSAGAWYWSVGTSMAAPHAAGVAALIISENGGEMHPHQVRSAMRQRAADAGKPGKDAIHGHGAVRSGH